VAGVDASRAGWVGVLVGDGQLGVRSSADFETLVAELEEANIICVDMPIGLPVTGFRELDQEARKLLGPRASSVFPTPPRAALEATTHAEAVVVCRELADGKGLSQQSWALGPKIFQVDAVARRHPERIREGHPEVSFTTLNSGTPLAYSKRTWNGLMTRRQLLERAGMRLPDDLEEAGSAPPPTTSSTPPPSPGPRPASPLATLPRFRFRLRSRMGCRSRFGSRAELALADAPVAVGTGLSRRRRLHDL
jgi:predicted RNase H-like nuclease